MNDAEAMEAVRTLLAAGVSQREVGRRLGVSKGFVWRTLRGEAPHAPPSEPREGRRTLVLDLADADRLNARVSALEADLAEIRAAVGHSARSP